MTEESIFQAALRKQSPAERATYLDEACGGDAALRQRIEARLHREDLTNEGPSDPATPSLADNLPPEVAATELLPSTAPTGRALDPVPTGPGRTLSQQGPDEGELLAFLEPSSAPGTLGRLGHYEVRALTGRGGMGVVLRAFDEKLHRVVAIKAMAAELAASATARKRFIREAQAAAAVCHEHVVTIHAVEEDHRPPYLVMQHVEGCSLQDKLNRTGPLPLREILRIGMQTAEGLAAAHKQGLVHRDIKPANILLEDSVERVKITDFGLARASDDASLTQSGVVAGTPQYMSPEQADGKPVDARSDLFSLGSVLYALCTGRAPFRANSTMAVLRRVCDDVPRPIREVNPDIPEWLCDIIARLHAKDPARRYQSAAEVSELLRDCLARLQQGAPVTLPLSGEEHPSPVSTTARRRRLSLAVMASAFLATVCLCGFGLWLLTRSSSQRLPWDPKPASSGDLSPEAKGETPPTPAAGADLLKDALLVMDFEKDAFYEKDGKTYVRDRSGHDNDGLCENVAFTPDGKAGGGLVCNGRGYLRLKQSLINRLPNYTITAWFQIPKDAPEPKGGCFYARAREQLNGGTTYTLRPTGEGGMTVNAWNRDHKPNWWLNASLNGAKIVKGQWVFLAVALRDGDADKGELRLVIDDHVHHLKSQMVGGGDGSFDYLGTNLEAALDEVTVFARALSNEEIQSIRRAGIEGKPLPHARLKAFSPPPSASLLQDALLVMDFEKDAFYEKDGKTYVRDRSGRGNDGMCENVAFTPEGKAGGGLACNGGYLRLNRSFINCSPNYTIAAWIHVTKADEAGWSIYQTANERNLDAIAYLFSYGGGGDVVVDAWNRDYQPDLWLRAGTRRPVFTMGEWVFVAAALRDGAVNKGELRLTVDQRVFALRSQMADNGAASEAGIFDYLGKRMCGVIDELVVSPHALSDREIQRLRQHGLAGRPLGAAIPPRR